MKGPMLSSGVAGVLINAKPKGPGKGSKTMGLSAPGDHDESHPSTRSSSRAPSGVAGEDITSRSSGVGGSGYGPRSVGGSPGTIKHSPKAGGAADENRYDSPGKSPGLRGVERGAGSMDGVRPRTKAGSPGTTEMAHGGQSGRPTKDLGKALGNNRSSASTPNSAIIERMVAKLRGA